MDVYGTSDVNAFNNYGRGSRGGYNGYNFVPSNSSSGNSRLTTFTNFTAYIDQRKIGIVRFSGILPQEIFYTYLRTAELLSIEVE